MQKTDTTPTDRSALELSFICAVVKNTVGREVIRVSQLHDKGERSFSFDCDPTTGLVRWTSAPQVMLDRLPEMYAAGILEMTVGGARLHGLGIGPRGSARLWANIMCFDRWCECDEVELHAFERYDERTGRYTGGHGFACGHCKGLVQLG